MRFAFGLVLSTIFMSLGCGGGGGGAGHGSTSIPASTTPPTTTTNPNLPQPVPTNAPGGTDFSVGPSLAKPRGLHTATLLSDGRVLIVGGLDALATGPAFVMESEIYDPATGTFTVTSDARLGGSPGGYMISQSNQGANPIPRYLHTATRLSDGRVLICGGYGVEQRDASGNPVESDLVSAFAFTPSTNTFQQVGNMNVPRESASAVLLPGGQVVVLGGVVAALNNGQGGTTAATEVFDPTANTFTRVSDMPNDRQAPAALVGNEVLIVGGLSLSIAAGQTQVQPFLVVGSDALDTTTGMFSQGPAPAIDRTGATLDTIGGDLILAGGSGQSGDVLQVERLTNGAWATVGQLSGPRESHGSASTGSTILLAGGVSYDSQGNMKTLGTADLFDAATNTVRAMTMAHHRNGCAVTALQSGHFLVSGGFENGTTDPLGLDGTSVPATELSR